MFNTISSFLGLTVIENIEYIARYNRFEDKGIITFPFDHTIKTIECDNYELWMEELKKLPKYNIKSSNNIEIVISNIRTIKTLKSNHGEPIHIEY